MSTQNLRRVTYSVIFIVTFIITYLLGGWLYDQLQNVLRSHTTAPGAQTAPIASQVGKVDLRDRGGLIYLELFFGHYAYSQDWNAAKLIPRSRQSVQIHTNGQILFGIHTMGNMLFNIILIISLSHTIDYLAGVIHNSSTNHDNQAEGIRLKSGVSPGSRLFIALVAPCDRTECTSA